ncbi:MAG: hypothetical protein OXG85_04935 [Chloroflexi bacterium]|nr:hypothetical protein [Chloroflexota bacterium]
MLHQFFGSKRQDLATCCPTALEHRKQLAWVMDVTFQEDQMRTRKGDSAQNLIALRNIALNILKKEPSKGSLRQKRYRAALDDSFLLQLLSQI